MPLKNHFWFHREPFSQRLFKEASLSYLFIIWRTFFHHKGPFVKKVSSDVKGSLWNHWDKKVLLLHCEASLFLRVYTESFLESFVSWTIGTMLNCSTNTLNALYFYPSQPHFYSCQKLNMALSWLRSGEEISATTFVLIGRPNWLLLHFLPALFSWSKERLAQSAEWTTLVLSSRVLKSNVPW